MRPGEANAGRTSTGCRRDSGAGPRARVASDDAASESGAPGPDGGPQGKGNHGRGRGGPGVPGRVLGTLERQCRIRPPGDCGGRVRTNAAAFVLSPSARQSARDGAGIQAGWSSAGGSEPSLLFQQRFRSERDRAEDCQAIWQAKVSWREPVQGDCEIPGLPRVHLWRDVRNRAGCQACGIRTPDAGFSARESALVISLRDQTDLSRRRCGVRKRGRRGHCPRGPVNGCGGHCRTDHRRRRCDHPAGPVPAAPS